MFTKLSNTNVLLGVITVVLVIGVVVLAITNTPIPALITQLVTLSFGGLFGYAVQPSKVVSNPSASTSGNVVTGG